MTWSQLTLHIPEKNSAGSTHCSLEENRRCSKNALRLRLTVLRQLGGADQRGDLEEVLADGAVAQILCALAGGRVALLLQLHFGGRQIEVERRVLKLLGLRLGLTKAEEEAENGHCFLLD